jgi:hypothetical protein
MKSAFFGWLIEQDQGTEGRGQESQDEGGVHVSIRDLFFGC